MNESVLHKLEQWHAATSTVSLHLRFEERVFDSHILIGGGSATVIRSGLVPSWRTSLTMHGVRAAAMDAAHARHPDDEAAFLRALLRNGNLSARKLHFLLQERLRMALAPAVMYDVNIDTAAAPDTGFTSGVPAGGILEQLREAGRALPGGALAVSADEAFEVDAVTAARELLAAQPLDWLVAGALMEGLTPLQLTVRAHARWDEVTRALNSLMLRRAVTRAGRLNPVGGKLLTPGTPAPDFALTTGHGFLVHTGLFRHAPLWLVFHGDTTCGASGARHAQLTQAAEQIQRAGVTVLEVWNATPAALASRFPDGAPFLQLADPNGQTHHAFGVPRAQDTASGWRLLGARSHQRGPSPRAEFLVDAFGTVQLTHDPARGELTTSALLAAAARPPQPPLTVASNQ